MYTTPPCDRLLIGVSGSIHAIHIIDYLLRLRREFAGEIKVIMTEAATRVIPPNTVSTVLEDQVVTDIWGGPTQKAPHIRLTRWAELFLVLPATANVLGKAANGIADDLLSTAILSSPRPVVFAPAMNPAMWASKALQRNVSTLRADGHYVVEPGKGVSLSSGELDLGLGPTPRTLLPHLWHVHLRRVKERYWATATAERARTPAAQQQALVPVSALLAGPPSN